MRKVIYTLLGTAAVVVATASIAAGAPTVTCGTRYTPACTPPTVSPFILGVACHQPSSVVHLPSFTASANAGIRKVTITVHSTTVTVLSVNGNGAKSKRISGVGISTAGLSVGVHTITIKVVDERGKSTTTTYHFAICKPRPVFTG